MTKLDEKTVAARLKGEQSRTLGNILSEDELPAQAFWLSSADEHGFRGAVIVHANDFMEAIMRANLLSVNPHGECQGMPIDADFASKIPEHWKNRCLTREECMQCDVELQAIKESLA